MKLGIHMNDCVWSSLLISEMLMWYLAIEEYKPKVLHYYVFIRLIYLFVKNSRTTT